ncbi:hypothetical protein C8R45DRAFT_1110006 [Mycena sanguinolenta]|nr:hypothetical protein C8R45DRAFT_1110006 [Mycena sanguinolenta]
MARGGLSNKTKINYGRPGVGAAVKQSVVPVNKPAAQRTAAKKAYNDTVAGTSIYSDDKMLELQDQDMPYAYSEGENWFQLAENDDEDWEDELPGGVHIFPSGEESVLQRHAGGEAIMHQIMEARVIQGHAHFSQLPLLVDAYLQFKDIGPAEIDGEWPLNCVGFDESGPRFFSHPPDVVRSNQTLVRQGYIGGSPQKPAVAFSLRTLEIYRQIHRVCPRYTIDSLAKTLTYLHKVPRKAYLAEQLTTAYDAYLAIQRELEVRVQKALGRDDSWAWKNICPPCFYKVDDELPLKLSWLGSLDGNNSLKLVDSTFRAGHPRFDNRVSTSFRWLTPAEVDKYQDEVKRASKVTMTTAAAVDAVTVSLAAGPNTASAPAMVPYSFPPSQSTTANLQPSSDASRNPVSISPSPDATSSADFPDGPAEVLGDGTPDVDGDAAWLNINELNPDDVESLQKCVNTCVERWKAAGPEARKKMWALFAVSGIFISVCRHGHVLVMCDMIRSGELMKYPLAICAKLFERYGADAGIGYNIMCSFYKTLLRSSLGRKTVGLRMRGVVPAFHGHAHNRMCQIGWHPMYVDGAGLEDWEECNFIYQNYRQAVEKITANQVKLKVLEDELHTTAADYEQDLKDERAHLESLLHEPPEVQRVGFSGARKLQSATDGSSAAEKDFKNLDFLITRKGINGKEITAIRTRYRTTYTRLLQVEEEVSRFKVEHNYDVRWTTDSKEYNDALVLTNERRYRRSIDKLERLVVQRLLELTKLSMSGFGALKTRADAIHRALNEYNAAAATLNPPRNQLVWAEVVQTVSLAQFDLLRDTRTDIRSLPWTQPARREAALLYFGIKRAKEEIRRLNVEITRLITFGIDEHVDFYNAIANNMLEDPHLARELSEQWKYQSRITEAIVERFVKTSHLPGFSGSLFPGRRLDRDPNINLACPLPLWATDTLGLDQVVVEYEENDGDTAREFNGLDVDNMMQLMDSLEIETLNNV